jgi:hypothetical protein
VSAKPIIRPALQGWRPAKASAESPPETSKVTFTHTSSICQAPQYDPEDTVRFYGLRLHEAGMVESGSQEILAQRTDWRSLNQLKKEQKG